LALLFNRLKLPFPETIDAIEGWRWDDVSANLEVHMVASNGAADASMIQSIKWLAHFKHHDDPKQEPGYLDDLKATFDLSKRDSHFGFHLFYGQYLIEAYKANRRYKEAMTLMESLKLS